MKIKNVKRNELKLNKLNIEKNTKVLDVFDVSHSLFKQESMSDQNYKLDEESGWYVGDNSTWLYNKDNDAYYSSSLSKLFRLDSERLKLIEMSTNSELEEMPNSLESEGQLGSNDGQGFILEKEIYAGTSVIPSPSKSLDMCEDRYITKKQLSNKLMSSNTNFTCLYSALFDGHAGLNCVEYVQNTLFSNIIAVCLQNMNRYNNKELNKTKNVEQTDNSVDKSIIMESLCKGIIKGFEITNNNFLSIARKNGLIDGTTALVCLIFGPDPIDNKFKLVIGNCGDSKLILGYKNENNLVFPKQLTKIHRLSDPNERLRIEKAGGKVDFCNSTWRVLVKKRRYSFDLSTKCIGLSTSRSIGDIYMKEPQLLCISEPEITIHEIDLENDLFIILATDGVTDFITDKEMAGIVERNLQYSPLEAASELTRAAERRGSLDDKTATVIYFKWSITELLKSNSS
ncbi:protein phosphatase 2C domain-containing protein [Cryptosporidium felis]|nr:protein phosphatase 2C domain-containing protein [Cryptosporidium felis]